MSATDEFRLRFQSLLAHGLAASEIAAAVGLGAASEVWGGDRPRDRPAWYVWLRDRPGAWQLELAGAEMLEGGARAGRFTVRHYPSPAAAELAGFSPEERRVAAALLDATGTPRIELASTIPDSLFVVGTLEWALDLEGGAALFALASLDRIRTRSDAGEVVRDVPGWRLALPMLSVVAGLHAQVERRAARRIVVSRQPGFEVIEGGHPEHRDAPESAYGEAFLVFAPANAPGDAGGGLLRGLQDPDAEIIADAHLERGGQVPHEVGGDPRIAVPVSDAWFGGRAHAEDRIACSC